MKFYYDGSVWFWSRWLTWGGSVLIRLVFSSLMAEKALSCKSESVQLLCGGSERNASAEWMFLCVSHSDAAVLTARTMKPVLWEMMSRTTRRRHHAAFKVKEKTKRKEVSWSEGQWMWVSEERREKTMNSADPTELLTRQRSRTVGPSAVWEFRWVQLAQNRRWMWPGLISLRRNNPTLDFQTRSVTFKSVESLQALMLKLDINYANVWHGDTLWCHRVTGWKAGLLTRRSRSHVSSGRQELLLVFWPC